MWAAFIALVQKNDGGIYRMDRRTFRWTMSHPYLALLEVKKAFKHIQYWWRDRTTQASSIERSFGAVFRRSDGLLWTRSTSLLRPLVRRIVVALELILAVPSNVLLIAATNTFILFIPFRFGSDYNEYIDLATGPSQRILVDDGDKDTFVYMHSTQWFNLESPVGRRSALSYPGNCLVAIWAKRHRFGRFIWFWGWRRSYGWECIAFRVDKSVYYHSHPCMLVICIAIATRISD